MLVGFVRVFPATLLFAWAGLWCVGCGQDDGQERSQKLAPDIAQPERGPVSGAAAPADDGPASGPIPAPGTMPTLTTAYAGAVTRTEDALPGVFIPPYRACQPSLDDQPGLGPDGEVCTQVAISGSTEPGRYFADYGACDVVRTQRPFWEVPPAAEPDPRDPRLQDAAFMAELAWARSQVEASACVCCHDSRLNDGRVGQWDVSAEPIWITTLSDSGLSLFAGYADSSVFGAYPPADNNGFDRSQTGIPTTDVARMRRFVDEVMTYRGLTRADAEAVPPFGGPIYAASVAEADACGPGQGIAPDGTIHWTGGRARYVYVLEAEAGNPGVPPNLDFPDGTLFRLDVRPDAGALESGVRYGDTPAGSVQRQPDSASKAPPLASGTTYKLVALRDVGLPITNCLFTFGAELTRAEPEPPTTGEPTVPTPTIPECVAADAFGTACETDADCPCAPATFCAVMPGQATGLCTATGCVETPSVCPADYSCFDVSIFAPGEPSICIP